MRVVSLVPSWTETLLRAGVNVVGRSRFCIHPKDQVPAIPAVGGTKDWDLARLKALKPDLLIIDREENPKFMSEQSDIPYLATHVDSIDSLPGQLALLSAQLKSPALGQLAERWERIADWDGLRTWTPEIPLPGLKEWGRMPDRPFKSVIYVIWRQPWMSVARTTFIGSVLKKTGFGPYLMDFAAKYPEIELEQYPPEETLLLFASEPYPFLKKKEVLTPLSNPYALVDGESYSWFGVRSLEFLEALKSR